MSHADEADHADEEDHAAGDPHFWVDPNNVIIWAENITRALSDADPANATAYQANAEAYITELQSLDSYIRQQTATDPRSRPQDRHRPSFPGLLCRGIRLPDHRGGNSRHHRHWRGFCR